MNSVEIILLHLEEARHKSIMVWNAIPEEYIHWKFDETSMSMIETVRHVLDCDEWYRQNIIQRSSAGLNYDTIFGNRPYSSIQNEIDINRSHRETFIDTVHSFTEEDLDTIVIGRTSGSKSLASFLTGISQHEAFHAGQVSLGLRKLNVPRPAIW